MYNVQCRMQCGFILIHMSYRLWVVKGGIKIKDTHYTLHMHIYYARDITCDKV